MTTKQKKAAEVNNSNLVVSKKNAIITEAEVKNYVENNLFEMILASVATHNWDNMPLEEDRVYHILKLGGIRIYWIKDNRRTWKRALKMLDACQKNGMTTPGIVVDAKVVYDWGLSLIDPATLQEVTPDKLEGAYAVMEGHGRFYAFLLSLAIASKNGSKPFDFHFIYKHYDTPDEMGKAYVSTNADMTRSTSKDRLGIAGARSKDPLVISYLSKIKNDLVISKGSYFWTFGREATVAEVSKLIYGEEDAPKFDKEITDSLSLCYDIFKEKFSAEGAEKIYRGVSAAQWCADRVGTADDKLGTATVICDKVKSMSNDVYTAILTASTNRKKHVTRDQVIKLQLDKMMK